MSRIPRAWLVVLAAVALFTSILFLQSRGSAQPQAPEKKIEVRKGVQIGAAVIPAGQGPPPPSAPASESELSGAITIPTDRLVKKRLEAARDDYIKHEAWAEASQLLQSVLDTKEDVFVQVKRKGLNGQEKTHWVSAKSESNRLIGTMGPKGLEFYELQYGAPAKALLAEGKKSGDPQILAQVEQRFFHTEAGAEATELLGTYALDRGDALMAALRYQRLLERQALDQLSPLTLFKAALAFRLSDDAAFRDALASSWKQLAAKVGKDGLRLEDENVSLDQLKQELGRVRVAAITGQYDWQMFRGNPARSARGRGGAPFLESKWEISTMPAEPNSPARTWIDESLHQPNRTEPMLSAFFPIAVGGKLLYRSYSAVHAVDIKTGVLAWDSVPATASLAALAKDDTKMEISNWFDQYGRAAAQNILFENSTNGTLSADNSRVYWVDDLAIPPHPGVTMAQGLGMNNGQQQISPKLNALAQRSRLVAVDLETGKLVWEKGDPDHNTNDADKTKDKNAELIGYAFLGPPLPLAGKLYVLGEKAKDLNLICLDAAKGDLLWKQRLGQVQNPLLQDVFRRVHAVHLAYGEGILVCPTNAGTVVGVDLLSRSLVWAFPYREKSPDQPQLFGQFPPMPGGRRNRLMAQNVWPDAFSNLQKLAGDWKCSAPIIQDGKVVFTAWDGSSIHCLNLHDGDSLWQAERRDDLYVAGVFQNKVVLVGKNTCRALNLADGKQQLWQVETGTPSGQGTASGSSYFLPLRKGEVCQIDLEKGLVAARSASPSGSVPGNLLFYEGDVISQNESAITCYPQVEYKVEQITSLLRKNPKDPYALTERGELRLYKGDLAGAVADLRDAVRSQSSGTSLLKARAKLYETLTELMQRDFDTAEQYLSEYKELCKIDVPAAATAEERQKIEQEQRRRQSGLHYLLAEGRVKQGRLVEAFQAYLDFGQIAGADQLVSVINEPAVKARPDVWAQGRIAALVAKAAPADRKLLEAEIAKRWQVVEKSKDLESLRRFVAAFGKIFAAGREARLQLAQRLIDDNSPLEAESHLLQLRQHGEDPTTAGRAVDMLARLMTKKGLLEDAAYYYRMLGRDFAKVMIRDGKTGADIFNELGTDKRFLPYLEEIPSPLMSGGLKVWPAPGGTPAMSQFWAFEPRGDVLPFFEHHRLVWRNVPVTGTASAPFKLLNNESNREEWSMTWGSRVPFDWPSINTIRVPCFTQGHLAVLYLGHTLYGIDFVERRKLWEKDLLPRDQQRLEAVAQQIRLDGDGGLFLAIGQGSQKTLGQIGALTSSYLCLRTLEGLVALDPLRGTVLWTKADVSARTQIFGDDEYVYLVEVRDDRSIGTTRALRGSDGAAVDVPDFSQLFQQRLRILGGRLLLSESDASGKIAFRLYDIRAGKDVWRKDLPAGALILRIDEPGLAAVLTRDGKLTVVDLVNRRELVEASVRTEHLDKVSEGIVLRDALQYYLVLNSTPERNANNAGPSPNFTGLSSTLVNKVIYAFRWDAEKAKWGVAWFDDRLPNQEMLLERFKDLPMVFLSSGYNEPVRAGGFNAVRKVVETVSIEKSTGKRIWKYPPTDDTSAAPTGRFHTIEIDNQNAAVTLVADKTRLIHYVGDSPPTSSQRGTHASREFQGDDEEAKPAPRRLRREVAD